MESHTAVFRWYFIAFDNFRTYILLVKARFAKRILL